MPHTNQDFTSLLNALSQDNVVLVDDILSHNTLSESGKVKAFEFAVQHNRKNSIDILIKHLKHSEKYNYLAQVAADCGQADIVKRIVPMVRCNPSDFSAREMTNLWVLRKLLLKGHKGSYECIEELLPLYTLHYNQQCTDIVVGAVTGNTLLIQQSLLRFVPENLISQAFLLSLYGNHMDCVQHLENKANLTIVGQAALRETIRHHNSTVLQFLIPRLLPHFPNLHACLNSKNMSLDYYKNKEQQHAFLQNNIDACDAQQQKKRICSELDHTLNHISSKRKI